MIGIRVYLLVLVCAGCRNHIQAAVGKNYSDVSDVHLCQHPINNITETRSAKSTHTALQRFKCDFLDNINSIIYLTDHTCTCLLYCGTRFGFTLQLFILIRGRQIKCWQTKI